MDNCFRLDLSWVLISKFACVKRLFGGSRPTWRDEPTVCKSQMRCRRRKGSSVGSSGVSGRATSTPAVCQRPSKWHQCDNAAFRLRCILDAFRAFMPCGYAMMFGFLYINFSHNRWSKLSDVWSLTNIGGTSINSTVKQMSSFERYRCL